MCREIETFLLSCCVCSVKYAHTFFLQFQCLLIFLLICLVLCFALSFFFLKVANLCRFAIVILQHVIAEINQQLERLKYALKLYVCFSALTWTRLFTLAAKKQVFLLTNCLNKCKKKSNQISTSNQIRLNNKSFRQ